MRLASGEDNGVRLAGAPSHNTARIAHIAMNVVICRTFLRAVRYLAIVRRR
jgi:hypothetical protein